MTTTNGDQLVVTYSNDAWEFFYALIKRYADDEVSVELNGEPRTLVRMEGDLFGADNDAVLVHNNDLLRTLAANLRCDEPLVEGRMRMYDEVTGECTIHSLRVL